MKPLKPRDKVTQRMTRDGLTLDNQTTGESVNVSSREAEQEYTAEPGGAAEKVLERAGDIRDRRKAKRAAKDAGDVVTEAGEALHRPSSRLQFTAEERADGVIEVVEEDGRGGVGVRLFHCHVDLGADAYGEDGVGGVSVVAVVVDVGLAEAHKGVGIHDLGGQRLGRKGGLRLAAQQPGQQAVGLLRMGGRCKAAGQQGECRCAEKVASCHFHRVDPPIFH